MSIAFFFLPFVFLSLKLLQHDFHVVLKKMETSDSPNANFKQWYALEVDWNSLRTSYL